MKVQYTFTANLSEIHEVLFDKLKRAENKTSVAEGLSHLKTSLIAKKDLAIIERTMQTVLEDVEILQYEIYQCLATVKGLRGSLEKGDAVAPAEPVAEQDVPTSVPVDNPLQKLANLATSLKNIE